MISRSSFFALILLAGAASLGSSGASAQQAYFAILNGGNEVAPASAPDPGHGNAGDQNGAGSASVLVVSANQICYSILVDNLITPSAAHIHENSSGLNGPIVIDLTPPSSGNPGSSAACITLEDPTVLTRIRQAPWKFYVNVHTPGEFSAGAIRGQLF